MTHHTEQRKIEPLGEHDGRGDADPQTGEWGWSASDHHRVDSSDRGRGDCRAGTGCRLGLSQCVRDGLADALSVLHGAFNRSFTEHSHRSATAFNNGDRGAGRGVNR